MPDSPQAERREPSREGEAIELRELAPRGPAAGATPGELEPADPLADAVKGGRLRSDSPPTGPIPIPYPNT